MRIPPGAARGASGGGIGVRLAHRRNLADRSGELSFDVRQLLQITFELFMPKRCGNL